MAGAVLFAVIAALALAGGVGVIASRQPVHSALSLLLVLGSLAVDYLLLGAQFIAVLQVIIYAGAIVVLFVFIIILHARGEEDLTRRAVLPPAAAVSLGAAFGLVLLIVLAGIAPPPAAVDARFGTVQNVGRILFSRFLLPFEAASVLLLIGMVGAVALGKRLPARSGSLPRGASPAAAGELRR